MNHRFYLLLATTLLAAPAMAQEGFVQSPAYKECTALAASNPQAALAKSDEWLKIDDGYAVHHCRAMAFYGMGQFGPAATELSATREKIPVANLGLRTYVARQGARAWVDAGRSDTALALLAAQINDMSAGRFDNAVEADLTSQLLLDRARLLSRYGKAAEAVQDLDHAVSLTPLSEDVLTARALAFEQLGDFPLARKDAEAVTRLNPASPQATELLRRLSGK